MNLLKAYNILLIIILISFISCKKEKSHQKQTTIATKIAEHIISNDSLKLKRYSENVYLHITSKKINDNNFKTYVSLNHVTSTKVSPEEINIKGVKTLIYKSSNDNFSLADPFFVPDAKSWRFLTELINEELFFSELKIIYPNTDLEIEELDF